MFIKRLNYIHFLNNDGSHFLTNSIEKSIYNQLRIVIKKNQSKKLKKKIFLFCL